MVGAGDLIVNTSPVQQRFLLNIAGANGVDILIDYRAVSADQFDSISKVIAVVEVEINFVEESDCSTYKTSRSAWKILRKSLRP